MTAQRIGIFTIDFPDPNEISYDNNRFTTLNDSVGFSYRISSNIQTLSTKGVDPGNDPYGILFVPDLQSDECKKNETAYVSNNATRLANLPAKKEYALIAVAPWFSPQCMTEYFAAARLATTKAFFVYQVNQGNAKPPVLNDASWNLQDGGSWQTLNNFPTYALSTISGDNIVDALAQYSGNLSTVPHSQDLQDDYDDSDYIRLWGSVSTEVTGQLPSLWVFLVIVLAILVVAVITTSATMHIIQRRRRNDLRRRVMEGQVDLEALGVKRLKVSPEVLEKLPIYTYKASDSEKTLPQSPEAAHALPIASVDNKTGNKEAPLVRHSSAPTTAVSSAASFSQPTCAICLDDFEVDETKVRELPCKHIFHPDCIDQFLLRNSSLCPMCKQSVLPTGACPVEITNMMVRRERHINRMRARGGNPTNANSSIPPGSSASATPPPASRLPGAFGSLGSRVGGAFAGRRIFSAPERTQNRPADIEMATAHTTESPNNALPEHSAPRTDSATGPVSTPVNPQDCSPTQNRREWARLRALQLLGNRHALNEADEEERGPRWKRTLRKAFPGFR